MKVVIVEDEGLAAERLAKLIHQYDSTIEIIQYLDSIESTTEWFQNNEPPDIAFFDIQLADGLSFDIFENCEIKCPVIFTTAFDDYAIRAFKVNSIDYLLKPIDLEELTKAFVKYKELKKDTEATSQTLGLDLIKNAMQQLKKKEYKSRFIVKVASNIIAVPTSEILYFFSENKIVWVRKKDGKKHPIDYNLDQLINLIDPQKFFRINRKYISSFDAIQDISAYSNSRLKIKLLHEAKKEEILISREKVTDFKAWLDQ